MGEGDRSHLHICLRSRRVLSGITLNVRIIGISETEPAKGALSEHVAVLEQGHFRARRSTRSLSKTGRKTYIPRHLGNQDGSRWRLGDVGTLARTMRKHNPKRRIAPPPTTKEQIIELQQLASSAVYTGKPAHKRNPGDFGLIPPAGARGDNDLCDPSEVFSKKEALELLRGAIRDGIISQERWEQWPKMVWAVAKNGVVLQGMCERDGRYHGFALPEDDPIVKEVRKRWGKN